MSKEDKNASRHARMAETVRRVIAYRERAPRSPRMARALKQLIWRYTRVEHNRQGNTNVQE